MRRHYSALRPLLIALIGASVLSCSSDAPTAGPTAGSGGTVSYSVSTVTIEDGILAADGTAVTVVTVQLLDQYGAYVVPPALEEVRVQTTLGSVSNVTALGAGQFIAIITAPRSPGAATVTATVGGQSLAQRATIQFLALHTAVAAMSTLNPAATVMTADGGSTTPVTVSLRDASGNPAVVDGESIVIHATNGTVALATPSGPTTFVALLTAPIALGRGTITATLNGQTVAGVDTIYFVAGALVTFSFSAVGGGAIPAEAAGTPFAIQVTAQDYWGHTITSFGGIAALSSNGMLSAGGGNTAIFTAGVFTTDVAFAQAGAFTITATFRSTRRLTCPPRPPIPIPPPPHCTPVTITTLHTGTSPVISVSP